jgi:tRNA (guanine37-N1)-methyltransferase
LVRPYELNYLLTLLFFMHIEIVTLFPNMFGGILAESIIKRGVEKGCLSVGFVNLRDFGEGRHLVVDDRPYGGGPGMLLKAGPLVAAIEAAQRRLEDKTKLRQSQQQVILLSAQGESYKQSAARELASGTGFVLVCGRYEGVDERVKTLKITREICVGDYVLSGGEIGAMVVLDTVARLIPGVLGEDESLTEESFEAGLLEYPHYTRPEEFQGLRVPEVLLSGNHAAIKAWRDQQQLRKTYDKRPELLGEMGKLISEKDNSKRKAKS